MKENDVITISDKAARYKIFTTAASIIVIVIGGLVLIGWYFTLPIWQHILPKMTANTAVAFILSGLALLLYSTGAGHGRQRRLAQSLAVLVTLIGLLTLSQYLFGWDTSLDQLLFQDPAGAAETSIPGRSSPHTAVTFTLVGLSLILVHGNTPRRHWLAQYFTLTAAFIALLALVGYGFSISFLFRISAYTGMALHTAVTFIVLTLGLLFLHPDSGFMALITANNLGGVARRLLLFALGVPLLVGWVSLLGVRGGLFTAQFALVLQAVLSAYIFSGAIWWVAHSLNRTDADRQQMEEQFRLVVEASPNALILVNTNGQISLVNAQAEILFGYTREELLGQPVEMLVPPQFHAHHNDYRDSFFNAPTARPMGAGRDLFGLRKDGRQVPIEIGLNPITTTEGSFVLASIIDITGRKQAEEQFRLVVEASPNAIILVNPNGQINLVNAQAETLFGYTREELLGQPVEMLLPPQVRAHHNDYRDSFFNAPTARPMGAGRDLFGLRKDGRQVPIEIGLNPITTTEGSFVLASIIDITERKQAEAEIAESLGREQAARVEAEASQQRLAFLVEASNTLASSLDYNKTLTAVAQLAVPRIADWCAVDVLKPDGSLERVAVVHTDPAKVELAYELQRRYPPDPDAPHGVHHVLRTGQAQFYPEIPEALLEAAGLNEEQLNLIRELGLVSAITAPMLARGRAFGAITFVAAESGRHYSEADLALTQELASRAALAVDNARLYADAQKLNEELEQRVIERTAQLKTTNNKLEREIAGRKRVEEELRIRRQELQDHIDGMSTMTAKVALDGTLLLINKIAQQATGLPMAELLQTNFLEGEWWAFDPEVQTRVRRAFQQACAGVLVNYDEDIFVFDQVLTINFSLVPVANPDGQVAYIVAEGRDITPLKQAEEELKRYSTQLEAANKELEAFAYSVSHDLRAPLRSIDGFSQALLEDYATSLEDEAQHYLRRVRAASQRMAELIDDLLSLSRLTRSEMRPKTVNLSDLIETIAAGLQQAEPERQVEFVIATDVTARADEQLMRAALENLLGNAWKFTAKHPQARIEFGVLPPTDDQPTYFVRDDGAGFDMAYADKLFGAFQRLHTPAEFSGTGIGLATVQRIIHRHGGRVWAEGAVEQGATFYFTLTSH